LFTDKEWRLIQSLRTPAKVQRFFSSMPYNWERDGGTLRSFREMLKRNEGHCLEAAVGAAVILEQHGYPPLLLDIESKDYSIMYFCFSGRWTLGRDCSLSRYWTTRTEAAFSIVAGFDLELFRSLRGFLWTN